MNRHSPTTHPHFQNWVRSIEVVSNEDTVLEYLQAFAFRAMFARYQFCSEPDRCFYPWVISASQPSEALESVEIRIWLDYMESLLDDGPIEHAMVVIRGSTMGAAIRPDTLVLPLRSRRLTNAASLIGERFGIDDSSIRSEFIHSARFGLSEGVFSRALEGFCEGEELERHRTAEFGTSYRDGDRMLWVIMHTTGCQVCKEGLGTPV